MGSPHSAVSQAKRLPRLREALHHLVVLTVLASGLAVPLNLAVVAPAEASGPPAVAAHCRSTNGDGTGEEVDAAKNGHYLSDSSRDSHTVTGIRIEPVFAKRIYTDVSRGFDATYIAYRITNETGAALTDVWVSLSGFGNGALQLANPADANQQIASLANNASLTRYFLVRATGTTEGDVPHDVRVTQGIPAPDFTNQIAGCQTNVKGVQRSIAANPNRVTAIRVVGTPTLGQDLIVEVDGAFGKVGQGSGPDESIMALTPASYAQWPTRALRLESTTVEIRRLQSTAAVNNCVARGGTNTSTSGQGSENKVRFDETLVIRGLSACITNTKQIYTATYTFRVIGGANEDPVIRPIASISSGTQIKYTGSFPSTEVSIPVSDVTVPATVMKEYVAGSATLTGAADDHVRVQYRIVASSSDGEVVLDAVLDEPAPGAQFVSATVTDKARSGATIGKDDVTEGGKTRWRFRGPFTAVAGSPGTPVTILYTVDLPLPAAGQTASYDNYAFAVIGQTVVADSTTISGIKVTADSSGGVTTTTISQVKPKDPQTIVWTPPAELGSGVSIALTGYADSGLPLTYTVDSGSTSFCTVSEFDGVWTLVTLSEGTCTVGASQAGNDDYAAAASVTRTIAILPGQVITATNDSTFGSSSAKTVSVVADSKLSVSVMSINTEVCTVAATTPYDASTGVTVFTATKGSVAGTCLLVANQSGGSDGNITWGPAQELEITIGSGTEQTITFVNPGGDDSSSTPSLAGNATVSAVGETGANSSLSGTDQLPIEFTSLTPTVCGIGDPNPKFDPKTGDLLSGMDSDGVTTRPIELRSAGTCTIRATQDGTNDAGNQSTFAPATPVTRTFTVRSTGETLQAIAFPQPSARTYGDESFTVTASSRTPNDAGTAIGLRVSFSVPANSNVCVVGTSSLTGGDSIASVAILSAGTCTIVADQAGDLTYGTAASVTRSFEVDPKPLTVTGLSATDRVYDATDVVAVTGTPSLVGVVAGDGPSAISPAGSATGAVANGGDVGSALSVAVSGLSLTGTRAADYTLTQPTLAVDISARSITIKADDKTLGLNTTLTCTVSVTVGALQGSDALGAPVCSPTSSGGTAGTQTITVSSVPIERAGDSVAGNYTVTLATGTLTVTSLTIPDLTAPPIEVVYGTDVSDQFGDVNATGGVAAKNGGSDVSGTVTHKLNGSTSFGVLDAGTYTLEVTFEPSGSGFAQASTTRSVTVLKRDLTVSGLSATDRVYDGTTNVTLDGTPALIERPEGNLGGVLAGDVVTLAGGTGSGTLSDASAGTLRSVTVTGLSLAGGAAANYSLAQPTGLTVTIQPRPLTITARSAVKVAGEADPSLAVDYSGFISGEDESVLAGAVSVTRAAGETPGRYTLTPSGGTNGNYAITRTPAELVIVGLNVGVQESGGVLTDRDVTCVCELLEPGTTATLTIFSTPTVIDTVTVDADGECPGLGDTIPTSVPDGPHTLRIDGVADDGASTPVSLLRPVTLRTQVVSSGNGGGGGTPPAPPSTDGPVEETLSAPIVPPRRPAPFTPPADPTDGAPREPAPSPTERPEPAQPPRDQQPPREQQSADLPPSGPFSGSAGDTFDLGSSSGSAAAAIPPGVTLRQALEVTRTEEARTLGELATESISGFAAGVGLRIEVIGARTTARFVLSATERIDTVVLSEALRRSMPTQATDFASIDSIAPVSQPASAQSWSPEERTQADDLFAASRLPTPVLLGDLPIPADASWIRIEMRGATYLPGSRVHLTVTSDPIVLASAVVERDGTVRIVGDLPVQILPAGEHRIRLVGTRVLAGIGTDESGEIVLPDEVLAEIQRFDLGTDATVRVVGDNGLGGVHTALRVVPLDPVPPWWTLWVVLAAWLGATGLRRRGRLGGMRRRVAAHALVVLAGVPAVVLGWLATTTVVVWWGAGLAVLASLLLGAIVPKADDEDAAGGDPEPVFSGGR